MKNVILVLGSGGARGLAHIAVIRELERRGFVIKEVIGTSMGAFVGGMYATGKLERFADQILGMSKIDFLRVADPTFNSYGLIKGDKIFDIVRNTICDDKQIEELSIPFSAIAVDIHTNSIVRLQSGSLFQAIRSSISIPNFFTPVPYNDRLLVDGGVMCPLPLSFALKESEDDIVVAVNLSGDSDLSSTIKKEKEEDRFAHFRQQLAKVFPQFSLNYMELMIKSLELMQQEMAKMSLRLYSPDISINIPFSTCQMLQFGKGNDALKKGEELAKKALDQYNNLSMKTL